MMNECLGTDQTSWEIGPYHSALPGNMRLRLSLDGEVITGASLETGFQHRGLEKALESHFWQAAIPYCDHLDPEGALHGELALCLAAEQIGEIPVPARAERIRVIVAELTRISCHFVYIARMARATGSDTMLHYVLRDREKILDLFELLTGARFSLNFLRFGGVAADVTEGFIERILETCELIRIRLKEYNDLFSFNHAFLRRSTGVGLITREQARRYGVTGPNLRSTGVRFDARKSHPYSDYKKIDFEVPIGGSEEGVGDSHDRFLLRLREITQSLELLKQATETIPSGSFENAKITREFTLPKGEAYSRIESSRGLLCCHLVSDGGLKPSRVSFRTPSVAHVQIIPEVLRGTRLEDLPVILASLDINIAEVDR